VKDAKYLIRLTTPVWSTLVSGEKLKDVEPLYDTPLCEAYCGIITEAIADHPETSRNGGLRSRIATGSPVMDYYLRQHIDTIDPEIKVVDGSLRCVMSVYTWDTLAVEAVNPLCDALKALCEGEWGQEIELLEVPIPGAGLVRNNRGLTLHPCEALQPDCDVDVQPIVNPHIIVRLRCDHFTVAGGEWKED